MFTTLFILNYISRVSNKCEATAQTIIEVYLCRWPIETFYQDSKQSLGLNEYRMRTAEAFKKHWCLVFVAYSILHLDCLHATAKNATSLVKTIGEACRQQAQEAIKALILFAHQRLSTISNQAEFFTTLFSNHKQLKPKFSKQRLVPNPRTGFT
jgi:hypothetical protein